MTDYTYAVIDGDGIVANIIASDNADAIEPLRLLIPDAANIILTTDKTRPAYIGGDIRNGQFRMPSPYASWVWDDASWSWQSPIPYPDGGNGYTWDEDTMEWVEMPLPLPKLESNTIPEG